MGAPVKTYLEALEREFKTGRATEHTHRPALKDFLEGLDSQIKASGMMMHKRSLVLFGS